MPFTTTSTLPAASSTRTATTAPSTTTTTTTTTRTPFAPTSGNATPRPPSSLNTYSKTPPRPLRRNRLPTSTRSGQGIASKSTPNLGSLFTAHAHTRSQSRTQNRSKSPAPGQGQGPRRPPSVAAAPDAPPVPALPAGYHHHHHQPSSTTTPLLTRKGSLAALTQSSLASVPDASESYALDTLSELTTNNNTNFLEHEHNENNSMAPLTPSRFASSMASYSGAPSGSGEDVAVGDEVDVPGGMVGTVRFVGSVNGRKGVFAGVELHPEYASRGKNSGDVDGVSYFNTTLHGAGIFLPLTKAIRRDLPTFPSTPGLKLGTHNSTNYTPPTPSLPKFSQSVSGGGPPRAPSPQHRRTAAPRTSVPRPESPVRRLQMTPGPPSRPSLATPAPPRPSNAAGGGGGGGRFGSPTSANKFSQSMRAPTTNGLGDPAKKNVPGLGIGMLRSGGASTTSSTSLGVKSSIGPRSVSALGNGSSFGDEDAMPPPLGRIPGMPTMSHVRPQTTGSGNGSGNGSVGSVTSSSYGRSMGGPGSGPGARPASRTTSHKKNGSIATATTLANNDEEVERLRSELDERERQLKDQASTLADMESSLTELQTLIESSEGPLGTGNSNRGGAQYGDELDEVKDVSQMRALLREKNDKIAMLTAEFDAHRADFRSTIDTLEMASTETERVYEKKIEDMLAEVHELESRLADVDAVAAQLKQLEELVQELEEGLEDARRGEAEARGEVEFLRGEVERTRTELRRERDKLNTMQPGHSGSAGGAGGPSFKDIEQKDDEIRGLKAIIHSLSQNAGVQDLPDESSGSGSHGRGESINERMAREALEREVAELRAVLATKAARESEMEQELEAARSAAAAAATSASTNNNTTSTTNNLANRASAMTVGSRSSLRDSRGTVVLARDFRDSTGGSVNGLNGLSGLSGLNGLNSHRHHGHQRSNSSDLAAASAPNRAHHSRGPTLDTMPESDAYSSVTESSTLWCEICETNGHDILTCTNMFGSAAQTQPQSHSQSHSQSSSFHMIKDLPPAPLQVRHDHDTGGERSGLDIVREALADTTTPTTAPLSVPSTTTVTNKPAPADVHILPNPMDSGPVAGKESGVVDAGKWCALCERDGHDSVDCPFEDAF